MKFATTQSISEESQLIFHPFPLLLLIRPVLIQYHILIRFWNYLGYFFFVPCRWGVVDLEYLSFSGQVGTCGCGNQMPMAPWNLPDSAKPEVHTAQGPTKEFYNNDTATQDPGTGF
jgi:hypothetical protein